MKNIECEERVMLSKEQYDELCRYFKNPKPFYQKNIYFDNDTLDLYKKHIVLRIREFENGHELTLKLPHNKGSLEINETLQEHSEIDKHLSLSDYKEMASLITYRIQIEKEDHTVVIDKNEYNGIVDYDLEIEAEHLTIAKFYISMICDKFNISYDKNYISKRTRAFNTRRN